MTIDTDIQAIAEYNANISDINTKINTFYPLINGSLGQLENNGKIVVRRSGVWSCESVVIYDGLYQNFGSVSGSLDLTLNNHSSRSAIIFTITGETLINGFGDNLLVGVTYTIFISQNSVGGYKLRWPANTSVLGDINEDPNSITVALMIKLPDGKLFVKNRAYENSTDIGYYEFRVVDDYMEISKSNVSVSGNALTNDWGSNTSVIAVNGVPANIGVSVEGSAGGYFVVNSDGSWVFTLGTDFDYLTGSDNITSSITYTASNTNESLTATISVLVRGRWLPSDEIDMLQWTSAAYPETLVLSAGKITQWSDKSGKEEHLTQVTSSAMPVIIAADLNGKDVVYFDGGDNLGVSMLTTEQPHWVFYVVKGDTAIAPCPQTTIGTCLYRNAPGTISSAGFGCVAEAIGSNGFSAHQHRENVICNILYSAPVGITGYNIVAFRWDTRQISGYLNGALVTTGLTANQTAHFWMNMGIGAYGLFTGKVAERMYTNGLLTNDQVDKVVGYLAHEWGLASKLDASHPYKSIIP